MPCGHSWPPFPQSNKSPVSPSWAALSRFGLPFRASNHVDRDIPAYRYNDPELAGISDTVQVLDADGQVRYVGEVAAGGHSWPPFPQSNKSPVSPSWAALSRSVSHRNRYQRAALSLIVCSVIVLLVFGLPFRASNHVDRDIPAYRYNEALSFQKSLGELALADNSGVRSKPAALALPWRRWNQPLLPIGCSIPAAKPQPLSTLIFA